MIRTDTGMIKSGADKRRETSWNKCLIPEPIPEPIPVPIPDPIPDPSPEPIQDPISVQILEALSITQ
jgi:hypothetical protein